MSEFRFKCFRTLLWKLGQADAMAECIELSIRHFLTQADNSVDKRIYIQQMSDAYGVKVNDVSFNDLRVRAAQLYLLNVFHEFEQYLEDFRKEHPSRSEWKDVDGSLFDKIRSNLNGEIDCLQIEIIQYYWHIRNVFMHSKIDINKYDKLARKVRGLTEQNEELKKYAAPNTVDALQFDDFILFTKVAKDVAKQMCIIGKPSDQLIVQTLMECKSFNLLRGFKNNPDRARRAVLKLIQSEYCLHPPESNNIEQLLLNRVLA